MDSFEWNKVAAALIAAVLFFMVINMAAESLFHVEPLETRAYIVEGVVEETEAPAEVVAPEDTGPDFTTLLAAASADSGARAFRKCQACHTIDNGGPNRVGPNLWNIVGRPVAAEDDYSYSDAMASHGGNWGFETLNEYLLSPKDAIPGNKMSFAGVKRDNERADLIAYLREQNDSPPPLPATASDEPDAGSEVPAEEAEQDETRE